MYLELLKKNTILSRKYQLEFKLLKKDETTNPLIHYKVSYFSFIDKFPIFNPTSDNWSKFATMEEIVEEFPFDEEEYTLIVTPIYPEDASLFGNDNLGELHVSGDQLQHRVQSILQDFKIYISIEFES